ncbi:hypothetical protein DVB69_15615 [Sporosarcina sp. BI001-red]|nr:hypothetical protein DVB69_15615 [Sporosarcina sp. BI001-red]
MGKTVISSFAIYEGKPFPPIVEEMAYSYLTERLIETTIQLDYFFSLIIYHFCLMIKHTPYSTNLVRYFN